MSRTIRKLVATAAAGAAAITLGTLPAEAAARTEPSVSFFSGAEGKAHWSVEQSSSDDRHSMKLDVPFFDIASEPINYAGITLHHVEGEPPPEVAPSFEFYSEDTGPSLGSPRLVIRFSDGGQGELRPLFWVQDVWTPVGGSDDNWDSYGGDCGFRFQATYEEVLACHPGATVTSAFVVSDSGYFYPPDGIVHYIDDLQYDGKTISRPGDNGRRN